ncbi:MAG: thioredoxin family protein [Oscillospiraceae bacterium]
MEVKLYTTHCPKCHVLSQKLNEASVEFEEISDINQLMEMGLMQAPMLEVDGKLMSFVEAVQWIRGVC